MNYYRISTKTTIGGGLSRLIAEGFRCDFEANKLAQELGAVSYFNSSEAEFGGISVVEFPEGVLPNSTVWELISEEEGLRSYAPKVELKTEQMSSKKAEAFRGKYGKIVSDMEYPSDQGEMIRKVSTIVGSRKAVQIYKRIQELPVVPGGSISKILGLVSPDTRPGLIDHDGWIYIKTKHEVTLEDALVLSKEEYEEIVELIRELNDEY